jgi:glutamyl/glutaminyl-tRNA synthetase
VLFFRLAAGVQVVKAIVEAHDSGSLAEALKDGEAGFKKWLKALGKEQSRKGKRLFMPTRVALTGSMHVCPTFIHQTSTHSRGPQVI